MLKSQTEKAAKKFRGPLFSAAPCILHSRTFRHYRLGATISALTLWALGRLGAGTFGRWDVWALRTFGRCHSGAGHFGAVSRHCH